MTTYASFKPSVQFLEAGEKAQQFANAANTFKPLLSQEARQSIEGIDKVSQAFTATGRALEHFGFDEAESYHEDQFDIDQDQVGSGKWASRWNTFKKGIEFIDKVNQARKEAGFDSDVIDPADPEMGSFSADSLTGQASPELINTIASPRQDAEPEGNDDLGGWWSGAVKLGKFALKGYKAYETGKQFGLWDADFESAASVGGEPLTRSDRAFDSLTGEGVANMDTGSSGWFQMHHDDGIIDGYLDTVETANRDMIITEFPEFVPGQTIAFDESGMDGLVAAGSIGDIDWTTWCFEQQGPCKPLDAMALNEPQTNNVF